MAEECHNNGNYTGSVDYCAEGMKLARKLDDKTAEANLRPRKCGVCGKTFTPDIRSTKRGVQQRTCRECLDKGLRAPKDYGWVTCPTCGRRVRRRSASQRYCSTACREKAYRERRRGVAK